MMFSGRRTYAIGAGTVAWVLLSALAPDKIPPPTIEMLGGLLAAMGMTLRAGVAKSQG